MTRDVVCVDFEIKTISKEIINYLDELKDSINSYNRTLKKVQKNGIKDEKIRAKIGNLGLLLKNYQEKLDEILTEFEKNEKGFMNDFQDNDVFSFPSSVFTEIEILIGMFC